MSSKDFDPFTVDNALHLAGGALIAVPFLFLPGNWDFTAVPVAALVGWAREYVQHHDDIPIWNKHRFTEAASWFIGALLLVVIYNVYTRSWYGRMLGCN